VFTQVFCLWSTFSDHKPRYLCIPKVAKGPKEIYFAYLKKGIGRYEKMLFENLVNPNSRVGADVASYLQERNSI
jgi:precorrin-6B methylase 1